MDNCQIALVDHGSYYDFEPNPDGSVRLEESFDTIIKTMLFTDRRADKSEISIPLRRRGWIGSQDQEYQLGSKLYLFEQTRLNANVLKQIEDTTNEALKPLVEDGFAIKVESKASITNGLINIEIVVYGPNESKQSIYYELWKNTGK